MKRTDGPVTLLAVLLLTLAGAVLVAVSPPIQGSAEAAPAPQQEEMSDAGSMEMAAEACSACHGEVVESFAGPHATLWNQGDACASCHGDAEQHIEEGGGAVGVFSFGADSEHSSLAQSRVCMECHGNEHPRFAASSHAAAGVSCVSCHSIHDPAMESPALLAPVRSAERPMDNLDTVSRTCESCHGAVFTQFDFNEGHRLREGVMSCASCHDPHAPAPRVRLAGFQRETCLECHTDKGGPFVFEHGSNIVEGCISCHTPHGSPNRHMLNTQRVAETCYSCHATVPGFHAFFSPDTNCTNCHAAIHGSNLHPAFLE